MRTRPTVFVSLLAALAACSAAQDSETAAEAPREVSALSEARVKEAASVSGEATTPAAMAPFERMVGGEWKMTVASGTSSYRTWRWGPGRHSVRVMLDGDDATGDPWRDLNVFYWHPGRKEVREFGVSRFARGITEGSITFRGETAQSDFDLHQAGGRRRLRLQWAFDGPDAYRATLLEASPPESKDYTFMVAWDLVRTEPPTPPRAFAVEGATGPSDLLKPFVPLLGTWESAAAGTPRTRSTFEWIPLADAIYARVMGPGELGTKAHLMDAYLYHHTGTGSLRCLALTKQGGVYAGDVTALEGAALQFDLKGYVEDRVGEYVVRIDVEKDGVLCTRVWTVDGSERTLVTERRHRRYQP